MVMHVDSNELAGFMLIFGKLPAMLERVVLMVESLFDSEVDAVLQDEMVSQEDAASCTRDEILALGT